MGPTTPSHNQRLKTKWVWDWLAQLPMHWGFEDSDSSGTGSGSDGSDSYVGDGDDEPANRQSARQESAGGKGILSTELVRKGRKRAFVEEEDEEKEIEIIDLTGDEEVKVLTGVVGRLVKRVRRSLGA